MKLYTDLKNKNEYLDCQIKLRNHKHLIVKDFFKHEVLNYVLQIMGNNEVYFRDKGRSYIGNDETFDFFHFKSKMNVLINEAAFINQIRKITGDESIIEARARYYRLIGEKKHFLDWHNDDGEPNRVFSCRIELSKNEYTGGEFEIREKENQKVYCSIGALDFGSALFFPIDYVNLEHQVKPVTSGERYSILLWFYCKNK